MALVNPREITREEAVILTELWQEYNASEFKVIFIEDPDSYWSNRCHHV